MDDAASQRRMDREAAPPRGHDCGQGTRAPAPLGGRPLDLRSLFGGGGGGGGALPQLEGPAAPTSSSGPTVEGARD